jgi:CheY-like chemotaxis protein
MLSLPSPTLDILVVDDCDLWRSAIGRALRNEGWCTVSRSSALGLVPFLRRHPPRVLLLDVDMPALDGERVVALVRSDRRFARTRVAFVSGLGRGELDAAADRAGVRVRFDKCGGVERIVEGLRALMS